MNQTLFDSGNKCFKIVNAKCLRDLKSPLKSDLLKFTKHN